MADPATIAGVAIGAISLSIQLLDGIFKGYQLFDSCRGMPEDCQYVSTCFLIERERLRDWVCSVGLDNYKDEASVSPSIRNTRLPLLAILTEMRTSINNFLILNGKYEELGKGTQNGIKEEAQTRHNLMTISTSELTSILELDSPLPQPHIGFRIKMKKLGHDVKEVTSHPKRLKWVAFDKKKANTLLRKLHELNDCLKELLDEHQARILQDTTRNTYIELVQMHNTVFGLKQLIEAAAFFRGPRWLDSDSDSDSESAKTLVGDNEGDDTGHTNLISLARFKEQNLSTVKLAPNLKFPDIQFSKSPEEAERTGRMPALYNPTHTQTSGFPIWIEWKKFQVQIMDGGVLEETPEIQPRIEELALLLTSPKPNALAVPPCLGFFKIREMERDIGHFGFVFTAPLGYESANEILTLRDALVREREPDLGVRFKIAAKVARAVLYLHSVNWLHKGLRSENVVWFWGGKEVRWRDPYVLGFEYSRPARDGEKTEAVPFVRETDRYRHPDIRGVGFHPLYRKTFDIFSLGVVLLEIALWKSVREIWPTEGEVVDDCDDDDEDEKRDLQSELSDIESELSHQIRSKVGTKFFEAIRTCIGGRTSFGIAKDNQETDTETSIMLQQRFNKLVVDSLKGAVV